MWSRVLRVALIATLAILGLSEGVALVRALDGAQRRRDDLVRDLSAAVERLRPSAEATRLRAGPLEAVRGLRSQLPPQLASRSDVELLDTAGHPLASFPQPTKVVHIPSAEQRAELEEGAVVTFGPAPVPAPRLLAYARLRARPETFRVVLAVEDLVAELREQHRAMGGQLVRLTVLLLAGLLALLPQRAPRPEGSADRALSAYQEALSRLKAGRAEEHERLEQDLQRMQAAQRDMEAMARAGELTAGIVHEVRNGLATIRGNARLLQPGLAGEVPSAAVDEILRECESLARVVDRFVEFARREQIAASWFDGRRLLEGVLAREAAGEGSTAASCRHQGETLVWGDEALLERAIENLVRNAREAVGPSGRISVESVGLDQIWRVQVKDDGPGFPPDLLAEGPRPFRTHRASGLGLGLALVAKVARLHGGTLALRLAEGGGALAILELPRTPTAGG